MPSRDRPAHPRVAAVEAPPADELTLPDRLVDLLPLVVVCLDGHGDAVFVNAAWVGLTGRPAAAHLGDGWLAIFPPAERETAAAWVRTGVLEQRAVARDVLVQTAAGERLLRLLGQPHHDRDGRLRSYVLSGTDVTEQVAREGRLIHAAAHDPLTGLANRAELLRRATMLASDASRAGGGVGALFLDLDDFKAVNDAGGHAVGDAVLRVVADRLRAAVRPFDVVARYGGDEFAVLLVDLTDANEARAIGGRVLDRVSQPIEVRGTHWMVRASVGIALTRDDRVGPLLEHADAALYEAKAQGKGGVVLAADQGEHSRRPVQASRESPHRRAVPVVHGTRPFHAVHFFDDDADLVPAAAGYVSAGLFEDCVTVVATPEHRRAINAGLDPAWIDAARAENRYVELDAEETLARIMRDGMPDPNLFGSVVRTMVQGFGGRTRFRAYGEMVGLLWESGQLTAALTLEDLWNGVQLQYGIPLLCAYRRSGFTENGGDGFQQVCSRHTQLLMAG